MRRFSVAPISPVLRQQVQRMANTAQTTMAIGWQRNDSGLKQIGYCPKAVVGPAFVYEVLETIEPVDPNPSPSQRMAATAARANERERLCLQAKQELDAMVGIGIIGPSLADWARPTLTPKLVARHTNDGMSITDIVDMQIELARLKQARDRKRWPAPKDSALAEVLADPSKLRAVVGAQLPELRPYRLRTTIAQGRHTLVVEHDMTHGEAVVLMRHAFNVLEQEAHQEVKTTVEAYLKELLSDSREAWGVVLGEVTLTLSAAEGAALTFNQVAP